MISQFLTIFTTATHCTWAIKQLICSTMRSNAIGSYLRIQPRWTIRPALWLPATYSGFYERLRAPIHGARKTNDSTKHWLIAISVGRCAQAHIKAIVCTLMWSECISKMQVFIFIKYICPQTAMKSVTKISPFFPILRTFKKYISSPPPVLPPLRR